MALPTITGFPAIPPGNPGNRPWNEGGGGRQPLLRDDPDMASPSAAAVTLLVVDDDAPVRETIAEILELDGYATRQAHDADSAFEILQRDCVSVMITDLSMPGEDGIELIRRCRRSGHAMPVILLTGYAEEAAAVSTIAGSNIHVLRKPVESRHLLRQVVSLVQKDRAEA